MSIKTLFHKAIQLGPWSLGAIAIAVLLLGVYLQIGENARAGQGLVAAYTGMTIFGLLSKIACGIGLIALFKFVLHSGGKPDDRAELEVSEVPFAPPPVQVSDAELASDLIEAQPARSAFWKRSRKAAPDVVETQSDYDDYDDLDDVQPRKSFGLRKLLIGLIGAAFAVMLASVVWELVQDTGREQSAVAQISIPTAQERVAQSAAETIVPNANPNRHWTDIDVTPIAQWAVAKYHLAVSGNRDAQITLGSLVGGVLFALFMIRFFFRMRRAMQPKTSANFSGMGIN